MRGNPEKIKGKGFDARPQDINKNGRPVGSKNRSTILEKWLKLKITIKNPETKIDEKVSLEDAVMLALIKKANSGDVQAIKEIQDTLYGKIQDKVDLSNKDGSLSNISGLSTEELIKRAEASRTIEKSK